jgi:hypothetical protein
MPCGCVDRFLTFDCIFYYSTQRNLGSNELQYFYHEDWQNNASQVTGQWIHSSYGSWARLSEGDLQDQRVQ